MKATEKQLTATEFKARCLQILDELEKDGIVITKRGHPVAKVVPLHKVDNSKLIGSMKGKIVVKGDLFSTGRKWNAQS
jgi:prevent-host-death family protein